jgi:nucleoside-diphosphate-sugar epimerase
MKVLVTGGGGFLGEAIIERLLARGDEVRSFSRADYPELRAKGVQVYRGDIANGEAVTAAADGCELIYHVAAKAGIWGPYREYHQTNVLGTEAVLAVSKKLGIRRLVFTSSPSVVFNGKDMEGVDESVPYPDHYDAPYPQTKALAEQAVLKANGPDLATVALRPHLIWGPGDNHLVPRILERARKGQLRRIGNRPNLVDSVYIDNAADAHLLAADRLSPGSPIAGKAYFVSQGEPVPLWDLVNRILDAGGLPAVTKSISPRIAYLAGFMMEVLFKGLGIKSEPRMTRFLAKELATAHWFDLSAARRDLGYVPAVSLNEGLARLRNHLECQKADIATLPTERRPGQS